MHLRNWLPVLLIAWCWKVGATSDAREAKVFNWRVFVANQSQLDQFMNNATAYEMNAINLSLTLDTGNYTLDIVKLMRINISDHRLTMEGKGGPAKIDCISADQPDPGKVQPLLRASSVQLDGLEFTRCPVPIMIEEASEVIIRNCVFQHHEHGALNIYNSNTIILRNCKFHNNTSDSMFTAKEYQGSAGGCSIGYNSLSSNFTEAQAPNHDASEGVAPSSSQSTTNVFISECTFTNNFAQTPTRQNGNSTDALTRYIFHGRGGALAVLVNIDSPLIFTFSDNIVINNSAKVFGGGVYYITQRRSDQAYIFCNSTFINNSASGAGGLALVYLLNVNASSVFGVHNYVYNCTFYNNTASEIAGATIVSAVYGVATNIFVIYIDCVFINNKAKIYGGAVDITSYDFFENIQAQTLVNFSNCTFEDNFAADGAAMNLIRYGAVLHNVTFKNNRQSAVRVIGCVVEVHDEVKFVGNNATNGGALYIISFGQIKVFSDTSLTFKNNIGGIGASIVVLSKKFSAAPPYDNPLHNPHCFLFHFKYNDPFRSAVSNFKLKFINNTALEATDIFLQAAQQCSWKSNHPPYFDLANILRWKFVEHITNSNVTHIESATSSVSINDVMDQKYPGEYFTPTMKMTDEMNQAASGFLRLVVNNSDQSKVKYKIHPEIVYHQASKPWKLMITVVVEGYTRNDYSRDIIVNVAEFNRDSESGSTNFTISVASCPRGSELAYNFTVDGFTCHHYRGNIEIGTCGKDLSILLLNDGQWGLDQRYTEQPENLTVYPCPPGYCRCFQNLCNISEHVCSFAYCNDDPDKQCNCDRKGYLCGDCKDDKGVSALLNRCVDCGNINILYMATLIIFDAVLIIVMLCKDYSFSALVFPTIFFINMVSYVGESYPTSYNQVGKYIYFINSLLSLYFPYDFCLYSGATPLATYAFRYSPLAITVIICCIGLTLHRYSFTRVKRFSWNNLWLLLTLHYGHVVYTSMTILYCPQVLNENGEHESRWFVKGSLQCFTNYHIPLALCAIIILLICLLLIPFLGLVVTGKLTKPYWINRLAIRLQYPFRENFPWWCVIELGRKFIFLVLLIPFPQNTAPPILILMVTLSLYAYVLPYKDMFVNIIELFFQLNLLMFLLLRSTEKIVDKYLIFPKHNYYDDLDSARCSNDTGIAILTWILLPFAYLPLVVIIGIFSVKMLRRLWTCIWYKCVKEHLDPAWRENSTTSYVNVSDTKFLFFGFEDDSFALMDATAINHQ